MKDVNVIFYDGVNDVHRCRSEIQGLGTGRKIKYKMI